MAENEIAYRVLIEGRVTGVGFRWAALDYAAALTGLRGYIRNASHSQVEAVIQGSAAQVGLMLDWLRHGPDFARVDQVRVNRQPVSDNLPAFTIRS
ncbi:MAG: acylphosphatase [Victivallaceae bacterium]|nr:acylphosphatase [Victivallaceae bacterium]